MFDQCGHVVYYGYLCYLYCCCFWYFSPPSSFSLKEALYLGINRQQEMDLLSPRVKDLAISLLDHSSALLVTQLEFLR